MSILLNDICIKSSYGPFWQTKTRSRDPAFYLLADPGFQTNANADPDPGQTLKSQKVEF